MDKQKVYIGSRQVHCVTSDDAKRERKIVYLKDRLDTRSGTVICSRITCPGFCACASKSK